MSSPAAGPPPDDPIKHPPFVSGAAPEAAPGYVLGSDDALRNADEVRQAILAGQALAPPLSPPEFVSIRRRRVVLPLVLFLVTCASTFAAGLAHWEPALLLSEQVTWKQLWDIKGAPARGFTYMGAVIGILLFHEMGHFVMTVRHHIPASLPYFIPLPIHPFGTMGAVIGMEGMKANRKQLFDIGLAGPLAGLVVAIPVTYYGITHAAAAPLGAVGFPHYHDPLIVKLFIRWFRPDVPEGGELIMNAWLMAGWIGLLITGLNMMPISQLDGGHVIYALFRRRAHIFARLFLIAAIVFVVLADAYIWSLMLILVILIGTDHPPTSDDSVELGPVRWTLGVLSLAIPVLCFPPMGMTME
jgi:Zn-dependent protease